MKRWLIILCTLSLLILAAGVGAQDERRTTTGGRTNRLRECPRTDCAILREYPRRTELIVVGQEAGEAVQGSDQWLRVRDPNDGTEGYLHISLTADYVWQGWKDLPAVPAVSATARAIYQRGLELGNDPNAFSKVGDCQNVTAYFLTPFDQPGQYNLGDFSALQATIDHFKGSWARESAAVNPGFNVASVLSPMWADPKLCQKGETPLQCEYRLHRPSIVIISLETWWSARPAAEYEAYLRQVVQFWVDNGVVPILGTKADNLEGDHSINAKIAQVGLEFDVPVWNFWAAVQPLPNHGLSDDGFHLVYARPFFNDAAILQNSWPVRNLTALQAIDAVWRGVGGG